MTVCYRVAVSMATAGMSIGQRRRLGRFLGFPLKGGLTKEQCLLVLETLLGDFAPGGSLQKLVGHDRARAVGFISTALTAYLGTPVIPATVERMFVRRGNQTRALTGTAEVVLGGKPWPPAQIV
jgi:uncharacterized SAM-dependent methyltransferase